MAGTNYPKRFLKKKLLVQRNTKINKKRKWRRYVVMATLIAIKPRSKENFHLYIIQLW